MFRFSFFIGIVCICLLGCSHLECEEAEMPGAQAGVNGKALLTISLSLPKGMDTRSQTNQEGGTGTSGGTEESRPTECKVTDAWVILGTLAEGQQAPIQISQRYYVDKFHYAGNPAQWSATIPCQPGRYRVAIIVNPSRQMSFENLPSANWDAMARYVMRYQHYTDLQEVWQENRFLMTNAYRGRIDDNDVVLVAGEHTHKDLYVQRACARFDYHVERADNTYEVTCQIDGTPSAVSLQLTEAGMMNISNNFNLFKMVVPDKQPGRVPNFYQYETNDNFVYDSDWTEKRIFQTPIFESWRLKEFFFFPSERNPQDPTPPAPMTLVELPKALNQPDALLAYASENTLPGVLAQINQLSTGVVFKGKFWLTPPSAAHSKTNAPHLPDTEVKEVYYRALYQGNELYTSVQKLKEILQKEGVIIPMEPTDADWAKVGILKFTRQPDGSFPVWYTYWNRHNDNLNPQEMGIMEFAVVRNNVYKLAVKSIASLGLPSPPDDPKNPWKPDGQTPDEQLPQLEVSVEVCDWVERELVHEI